MLHINDLSDDCLLIIFSRLSLSCKLTLHRVCPRWRSLQYSVTCTHNELTLLLGSGTDSRSLMASSRLKVPYLDQIEPHNSTPFSESAILELSNMNQNVVSQLEQLLTKVTSLELCLNDCQVAVMNYVLDLIRFWSPNLKCLSLFYYSTRTNRTQSLNGVLSHIQLLNEHCLALDYLSIELRGDFSLLQEYPRWRGRHQLETTTKQFDLPCLGWLSEFRFYSNDPTYVLLDSLKKYPNNSLKKIAIGNLNSLFKVYVPQIVSKFTLLKSIHSAKELFQFTSLTTLSMEMFSRSWAQITAFLSPLKRLVHVKFGVTKDVLSQSDSTPSFELAQLPSIRIIQIYLTVETYHELQSRHWGWIFPSLELLELELYDRLVKAHEVKAARLNQLLEPFKCQCDKLRRIVTLDKDYRQVERKAWELVGPNNWKQIVTA